MQLLALEEFCYAGKALKAGEKFTAESASDAHILCTIGRAREIEGAVETREMKAGDPADMKSRRYNRRDMQAKD